MPRAVSGVLLALATCFAAHATGCWLTTSFDELSCSTCGQPDSASAAESGSNTPSAEAGSEAGAEVDGGPCGGAKICDDFEDGLVAPWSKSISGAGTVGVDGSKSHSGTKALHVQAAGTTAAAGNLMLASRLPLKAPFYVRLFAFVPASPMASEPNPTTNVLVLLTRAASFDTMQLRVEGASGAKDFGLSDNTTNSYVTSNVTYPFDAWACMEWFIGTESTRLWSGNTPVSGLDLPVPSSDFVELDVGWTSASSQAARPLELWIDDVVVSPNRVGCP